MKTQADEYPLKNPRTSEVLSCFPLLPSDLSLFVLLPSPFSMRATSKSPLKTCSKESPFSFKICSRIDVRNPLWHPSMAM